ncbi:MAG TPA: hypothetical protein ENJ82_00525, partial [Bacteroidetes bacterium]|nr:hypothetical protein [Bacteroidota bacterium]
MFKRLLSFLLFFNLLTFSIPQLAARSQDQFLSDSIRSIKMFYIPSTLGKRLSETEKYYSRTGLLEKEVFYTIGDFPEETWNNSERVIASTVHHTYNEAGQCIEDIFYENNIETSRIVYGFDENGWLSHELNYYNGKMTYQILYLRDEKGRLKESYRLIESQLAGIHKLASLKKFQ